MIRQFITQLENHVEIRQTLSKLRQAIKVAEKKDEVVYRIQESGINLSHFLQSEDAKTRKNAALLIGDLQLSQYMDDLYESYMQETQLFVKSSYLIAMHAFDFNPYLPELKEQLARLCHIEVSIENKKHVEEEIRILTEIVVSLDGIPTHTFQDLSAPINGMLLTNPLHAEITATQLDTTDYELLNVGVKVQKESLEHLLSIRTYQQLLLTIPGLSTCEMDPILAANTVADSPLLKFLINHHDGAVPFYFRVEVKSKRALDEKSDFAKKFSSELERLTQRNLINSTSHYEVELRLIESKLEVYNILVKLNTIPDQRFSYRKNYLSTSIRPEQAALLVELAKEYMIADAQVLDPFCGVGTMLIERQIAVKANTSYGIDILEEAIVKAKENTALAGQIIHYVNKNCCDFTHEYLFDEIFTNMPFAMGHTTDEQIYDIYVDFLTHARKLLTKEGILILYTHHQEYIQSLSKAYGYSILEQWEITDKNHTHLIVLHV
ncbi:MAG: methyltransferase [Lachnospiraceae bacterium]